MNFLPFRLLFKKEKSTLQIKAAKILQWRLIIMNNQEIRFRILKLLYDNEEEQPSEFVGPDKLEELGLEHNKLLANVTYLEEKGYIELFKGFGAHFNGARITAYGKDLVEDESSLRQEFPTVQFIIQHGQVNIANQNSQNIQTTVNITNYDQIFREVETLDNAGEIKPHVEALRNEDSKPENERDSNVITKSWKFIKENASSIVPLVEPVVRRLLGL